MAQKMKNIEIKDPTSRSSYTCINKEGQGFLHVQTFGYERTEIIIHFCTTQQRVGTLPLDYQSVARICTYPWETYRIRIDYRNELLFVNASCLNSQAHDAPIFQQPVKVFIYIM